MEPDREPIFADLEKELERASTEPLEQNVIKRIKKHLEYFGYRIEGEKPRHDDVPVLHYAAHFSGKKPKFSFKELEPGVVLFQFIYSTEAAVMAETYEFLNRADNSMYIVKSFCTPAEEGKLDLRFEAAYCGAYSVRLFANFFDRLTRDIDHFHSIPGHDEIFYGKGRTDEKP